MLHIYVYDPREDFDDDPPSSAMRPAEYLRKRPPWEPDLGDCLLLLDGVPGVRLLELNAFGWLHEMAPQLEEAARRLEMHRRALICSRGEGYSTFLSLDPDGDTTLLSVLMPLPTSLARCLPLPNAAPTASDAVEQRELLYDYVETHRAELRPSPTTSPRISLAERRLQNIPLRSEGLAAALREEALAGMALYRALMPKSS